MSLELQNLETMNPKNVTRIEELDVLRAILIFFVVFGHSQCCLDQVPLVRELIYSFHMPAMFTLSGLVTALSWKSEIWRKVGHSARRLLVPYLLFGLVLLPMWVVLWEGGGFPVFLQSWNNSLLHNRGLWYLPACFLLVCSFVLVAKGHIWLSEKGIALAGRPVVSWCISCLAVFLVVSAGYWLTHCDFLRSVLVYWFSFYAGVALAHGLFHSNILLLHASPLRLLLLSLLMFVLWLGLASVFVQQPHALVGNIIKPFSGLVAFLFLLHLSRLIRRIPGLARIGESTLAIYCVEGVVGWRFFQMASPSNAGMAAFWSLMLMLVVHGARMVWRKGIGK